MIEAREIQDESEWNNIILDLEGHPLQMWGWGEVKSAHNWSVRRVAIEDDGQAIGAAQILSRHLPFPFKKFNYVPRGPALSNARDKDILSAVAKFTKSKLGGVILSVEPDTSALQTAKGWRKSANTVLIPRTLILNLTKSEDELLSDMSKKTRQYIRKSSRDGVVIKKVNDPETIAQCMDIYRQTAERAGFAIHADDYYQDINVKLADNSVIFVAYSDDKPVAFLWLAISGAVAFELYGGMNEIGQNIRANYALKWHAITACKRWGINRYDLNGLLNDGVSTFKQGFSNHEDMLVGTYELPLSPLSAVWSFMLPRAKKLIRLLKKS